MQSQNYVSGGGYGSARDYGYQRPAIITGGWRCRDPRESYLRGTWGPGAHAGYEPARAGRGSRHYRRSDERIREVIYESVIGRNDLDAEQLDVDVHDGIVRLSGRVPQRWMKHAIEDIAATCHGVTDVENRMRVAGARAGA
jgi:hypothetical protein